MLDSKFKLTVKRLIMPLGFVLENLVARTLLMWYGFDKFVGVDKSPIMFTDGEALGDDASFDRDGSLPIGCGHGRFGTREPALSVAKELGIDNSPELLPLLDSLKKDVKGSHLRLPVLFSAVRRHVNGEPKPCISVMSVFIDAIIMNSRYNAAPCQKEHTLMEVFETLIKRKIFTDAKIIIYLREQVKSSIEKNQSVGELSYVLKALFRRRNTEGALDVPLHKESDIIEWMRFVLTAVYSQQIDFWKALEEIRDIKPTMVRAYINGKLCQLTFITVYTDNDQVAKAARSRNIDILLHCEIKSKRRHISFNPKVRGLSGQNLTKMIEWFELSEKKKRHFDWKELGNFDKSRGVTWWHVDNNGTIHNGTVYWPQKISLIGDSSLIEAIEHAFDFNELKYWCSNDYRRIQITSSPQPVENRTTQGVIAKAFDSALPLDKSI
ncbi:MAG: hypothetical protein WCK03_00385 [Candidatus Taylorbacteria bacterium]